MVQLQEHARALALRHRLEAKRPKSPDSLLARLSSNAAALEEAHTFITHVAASGMRITPAAEWFLDNYHLIEEQIRTARRHLPRGYSRELPRLANGAVGRHAARLRHRARADLARRRPGRRREPARVRRRRTSRCSRCGSASCGRSRSCCGWR